MSDQAISDADRDRLVRYRDTLIQIAKPGEDKAAAQRSAEAMREIALKALRSDR